MPFNRWRLEGGPLQSYSKRPMKRKRRHKIDIKQDKVFLLRQYDLKYYESDC